MYFYAEDLETHLLIHKFCFVAPWELIVYCKMNIALQKGLSGGIDIGSN